MSSASQEIHRVLWKPKVHYRIHKNSPPVPNLSKIDRVHELPSHSLKIHCSMLLPSTPRSYKWSLSLIFIHRNLYAPLLSSIRATRPVHLYFLFDHRVNISGVHIIKFLFMLFLHSPVTLFPF